MLVNYNDYKDGGSHKSFTISVVGENITVTNENMRQDSITLDEALCSERNLRFGCCESSQFSVHIANVFENFEGKQIQVSVTMDNKTTKYGTFKVKSDKPTADRIHRKLVAYDAMNDIINTNVLTWFKGLTFPITLKNFRDSFFSYLGITQETRSLINDDFVILGGFTASDSLSGRLIITSICELNGVFGHINRDGKFDYIDLTASSSFDCPPYENNSVKYEDYVTSAITKVTMRGTASDVGTSVGTDGNEYIIQGNPLIYGSEGKPALVTAMTRLLNKIKNVVFRPFELGKTIGNPCVELGDAISIETKYETIESYVLRRTLTGIQALRDKYSAEGDDVYPAGVSILQDEISRTKGKMLEIESSVDGLRIIAEEISEDLDENYYNKTEIDQTVDEITLAASQTYAEKSNAIKTDTLYYLATSAGSGVTRDTPGWTTTVQSMTATNKYLWTYHLYTYDDNHTSPTNPIITGRWGDTGADGTSFAWNMLWDTNVNSITKSKAPANRYIESATTATYSYTFDAVSDAPVPGIKYAYHLTQTSGGNAKHSLVFYSDSVSSPSILLVSGKKYTLSLYCKWISGADAAKVVIQTYDGTTHVVNRQTLNKDGKWHKYSYTFTANEKMSTDLFRAYMGGCTTSGDSSNLAYEAMFCGFKLEEGEVATEWTLNPDETGGIRSVTSLRYASNSTTAPAAPTSEVTRTDTATGVWTKGIPALTSTYKYMYTCDQIQYDNGTFTWTTVVRDNALTDLTERVSQAELKITPEAIVSTVEESDTFATAEEFSALKIGGENLIRNTRTFDGWVKKNYITVTSGDFSYVTFQGSSTGWNSLDSKLMTLDLLTGGTFVLSFDYYSNADIPLVLTAAGTNVTDKDSATQPRTKYTGYSGNNPTLPSTSNTWKRVSFTSKPLSLSDFTSGSGDVNLWYVQIYNRSDTSFRIRKIKLEVGNRASDWSAASEDATDYTDDAVNNIEIGGTQLLAESSILNRATTAKGLLANYEGDGWWNITGTVTGTAAGVVVLYGASSINLGGAGDYTLSFEGNCTMATNQGWIQIGCYQNGQTSGSLSRAFNLNGDTKLSFTVPSGEYIWRIAFYIDAAATGYVCNKRFRLKLEKGNKATDWTPSNDDLATSIGSTQLLKDTNASSITAVDAPYSRCIENSSTAEYSYTFDTLTDPPCVGIKYGFHITTTGNSKLHSLVFYSNDSTLKNVVTEGKKYTFSYYCKWISGNAVTALYSSIYTNQDSKTVYQERQPLIKDGKWHKYTYTFTATSVMAQYGFRIYCGRLVDNAQGAQVGEAIFCGWKLEEGNTATSWSEQLSYYGSKSEITQLSNKIALKVNSSGRLVTVALGVDPASSTSYVKVKADDIDIISNGNIQLTANSLGIDSTNFKVNKTTGDVEVTGAITTTSLKIDNKAYLSIVTDSFPSYIYTWATPPINSPQVSATTLPIDMLTLTSTYGLKIAGDVVLTDDLHVSGQVHMGGRNKTVYVRDNFLVDGQARIESYLAVAGETYLQDYVDVGGNLAVTGNLSVNQNLIVSGVKSRYASTEDYGDRLLYCYETAAPMFGDIGEGKIAEDGKCYIWLDGAFSETIKTESYQVFLQKYGQGECYVTERTSRYFVVEGDAGMRFGWELKAKQAGYENLRLETYRKDKPESNTANYGEDAMNHITSVKNEREVA